MEFEKLGVRENPLMDRVEVTFLVHHAGEPTPTRDKVRELVARNAGKGKGTVIVDDLTVQFGRAVVRGFAKVYPTPEAAKKGELHHLLVRNKLAEKKVKTPKKKAAKPAAAQKKGA